MGETVRNFSAEGPSLNSVGGGLALAQLVVAALKAGEHVQIDLALADRMTPSYANALVMTILEAVGEEGFRLRVVHRATSPMVSEAWAKAVERYKRGIRLTTQQTDAA